VASVAGPPPPGRVWRLRGRAEFADLYARGRRVRSGPVTVTYLAAPDAGPPRVAFAVGRAIGPAVVRNRIRRRLRAITRELAARPGGLPAGSYLIGVRPPAATLDYVGLRASVERAVSGISGAAA
jgi:ribonuclease P protein component